MEITPKWDYVKGSFDTKDVEMLCLPSDKHGTVTLNIREKERSTNYPVAKIKLYSGDTYAAFKEVYEDAVKLGNEIARRWNECETKK
jgi:hypothetical protein